MYFFNFIYTFPMFYISSCISVCMNATTNNPLPGSVLVCNCFILSKGLSYIGYKGHILGHPYFEAGWTDPFLVAFNMPVLLPGTHLLLGE